MKKFFSLVLALVMALSLTTVAWGAEVPVADTAALNTALTSASSGTIIKLAADTTYDLTTAIPEGVTLEGVGTTTVLNLGAAQYKIPNKGVTIKNVTIKDEVNSTKIGLFVAGVNVTLESVNYASANEVAITLRNKNTTENTFTLKDSTLSSTARGIGWCYFTGTILVEDSVIDSGNSIHIDEGDNVAKIVIKESTLYGNVAAGTTGSFEFENVTFEASKSAGSAYAGVSSYSTTAPRTFKECTFTSATDIGKNTENFTLIDCNLNGTAITAENIKTLMPDHNYSEKNVSVNGDVAGAVAEVGGTQYKSLTEAMKAVTSSNNTLTLLDNVTTSEKWDCRYNDAKFTVPVTIDGNGKTLKLTGEVKDNNWNTVFRFEEDATVKNLTIDASAATGIERGISAKKSIVVENCTFIGNDSAKRAIIFGEGAGDALGNVTATVTGSTFTNWSYGVSDNQSGKDAKSVSITGNTFNDASVLVSASEDVIFNNNNVDDGYVNISSYSVPNELAVTATGNTLDVDFADYNSIKAKTITTDTNDFATTGTLVAPAGYVVLKTTTGAEVVVPAVAFGDKYDLYQADAGMNAALKAKNPDVAGLSFDEFDAKTNKDGSGRVAYIAANNGEYFVKTTSPTIVDYAVTDAGKNTVLYYVTVAGTSAANFEYEEAVSAFTNFGVKCDQVNITPVAGATYFKAADGDVYMADDAGTGVNYLLNGKVVSGVHAGTPEEHTFVINNYKYDATLKQNIPTSAVCTKCLMNTGSIYLRTKVPATYTLYTTTGEGSVNYTVALPGASAVPSAPAVGGTVVESAATFDAGVAMYVGMSVMAAAGSMVVLKKRED